MLVVACLNQKMERDPVSTSLTPVDISPKLMLWSGYDTKYTYMLMYRLNMQPELKLTIRRT
jgi:hypothetical protein